MAQHTSTEPRAATTTVVLLVGAALGAWAASTVADRLGLDPRPRERQRSVARGVAPDERRRQDAARPGAAAPERSEAPAAVARTERGAGEAAGVGDRLPDMAPPSPAAAMLVASGGAADAFATDGERAAAERLSSELRRLVRDLEFNAGLREPPQQTVVPPPAPWRPDPRAEGQPPPVVEDVQPRAAPATGGTRVTIRGQNLRVTQVMFGSAGARIVGAAADAVTVVAPPAGAGPVVISVTNDDGSYALAGVPFTYRR